MNNYIIGGVALRKIISFILIIFILIWSYNLFIDNFIKIDKPEVKPYKGVINILDTPIEEGYRHSYRKWLQDRIAGFERNNPGIYMELVSGEETPDIVPITLNFSDFSLLESLDDHLDGDEREGFKHQVLKPLAYDKELKAIPIAMSTYVLYINLEKFDQKGIMAPLNGEWTYEEFIDILGELTYVDPDDEVDEYGLMAPMGLGNYHIWGIILSDGAEMINPRRLRYNFYGEKAIKGLERVIDLRNEYAVVPSTFGKVDRDAAWKMFHEDQNIAVYIGGSWDIRALDKSYGDEGGFNFDIASYPTGDKGLPMVLSNDIISYGVMSDSDSKKVEACAKFLKYLTTDSSQRELEDVGLFTVKRGIDDMYNDNMKMKRIEESLAHVQYIPFVDDWMGIEAIIHEEISKAISAEKPSYEAIEEAKNRIDEITEK